MIEKVFEKIRSKAYITFDDWDEIGNHLSQLDQKIKELTESRENWKSKYFALKRGNTKK